MKVSPNAQVRGFTLFELLSVLAIGVVLAAFFGAYAYQALANRAPRQVEIERFVYDLRSQMINGHLRAQLGSPVSVSLENPPLPITEAPPFVTFLPPDGRLSGDASISFLIGEGSICYSFHISREGICHIKAQDCK